jgi:hypothetical protein
VILHGEPRHEAFVATHFGDLNLVQEEQVNARGIGGFRRREDAFEERSDDGRALVIRVPA